MTTYSTRASDLPSETRKGQVWSLVRWNLFLIRRRPIGKILFAFLIGGIALIFLLSTGIYFLLGSNSTIGPQLRSIMTFPSSLHIPDLFVSKFVAALACILAGTFIGSEYSFGTQRQMLSRSTSRIQVLTAQIIAQGITSLISAGLILLICGSVGLIFNTILPSSTSVGLTVSETFGLLLYWVSLSYQLFIYMLFATLAATLGRSAIAGIAFALGYFALENIAVPLFTTLAGRFTGATSAFFLFLPGWLPGASVTTLTRYTEVVIFPGNSTGGLLSLPLALLIVLVYSIIFAGGSYWSYCTWDITE